MNEVFFENQTLSFSSGMIEGLYGLMLTPDDANFFEIIEGETYLVTWDGITVPCVAEAAMMGDISGIGIGNLGLVGIGEVTQVPFVFGMAADKSMMVCYTLQTNETHVISVSRQIVEKGPSIVLKNYFGNDVTYDDVKAVIFDTPNGGQQIYSAGEVEESVEVDLNLLEGNQIVQIEDKTIRKVTVKKPDTLQPENIKNGVNVAGVEGELIGDSEEITVPLSMAVGNQEIVPSAVGKLLSKVTVQKPETLIPENIAEGIDIAGIIGTLVAGGGVKFATGQVSGTGSAMTITHNLGVVPDLFLFGLVENVAPSGLMCGHGFSSAFKTLINTYYGIYCVAYNNGIKSAPSTGNIQSTSSLYICKATATTITVGNSTYSLGNKTKYAWLAVGGLV